MSKMFYGQINMTQLIEAMKEKHSAFRNVASKKEPGKNILLVNVTMWENDIPDQFGNTVSLQLNSREDAKALEGKVYIGNLKLSVPKEIPVTAKDTAGLDEFMNAIPTATVSPSSAQAEDDVPF